MAAQFILFNFANYLPSIAMEVKVSKEIRDPRQTNMSPEHYFDVNCKQQRSTLKNC